MASMHQPRETKGADGSIAQATARRQDYRRGFFVLVGLALLTGLEFLIGTVLDGSTSFLFVIALAKAGLILQYYMHVERLWSEEAH
jgi:cytochrome c oxidase subunit IV